MITPTTVPSALPFQRERRTVRSLSARSDSNCEVKSVKISEKQLESEISRLKAEKAELEQQEQSSEGDSQILTDLKMQLASERQASEQITKRFFWKGISYGAGGAGLLCLLWQGVGTIIR